MKWVRVRERHGSAAGAIRAEFESGKLSVVVPPLLDLEVLNVAARSWKWGESRLSRLAVALDNIGFDRRVPALIGVAVWAARGLSAYDASYVALAEQEGIELVTDDARIVELAPGIARPLQTSA